MFLMSYSLYRHMLPLRSSGVTITTNRTALSFLNISYDQRRTDLMHFTAAIPLLAIKTYNTEQDYLYTCF